jgi:hypothetical protein
MKYVATAALFLIAAPAWACSCGGEWSLQGAYSSAEHVAVVTITSVAKSSEGLVAESELVEPLKGAAPRAVRIFAAPPGSSCHVPLMEGTRHVLFWSGQSAAHSACNPQPRLEQVPNPLLESWREGANNSSKPTPLRGAA